MPDPPATSLTPMPPLLSAAITGVAIASLGLALEFFKVEGFHYGSGYCHLQFLNSYFYALHSTSAVVQSVAFLNFLVGAIPGLCIAALWKDIESKRPQ